ncbi:MAG: hypothetical protein KAG06_08755 [Methylococcales bacterium]|nr:hypothetical protein [Methylococcales bacterium]
MKNQLKISLPLLLYSLTTSVNAVEFTSTLDPTLVPNINKEIGEVLNTSAADTIYNDLIRINKEVIKPNLAFTGDGEADKKVYNLSTLSGTLNGRKIKVYTTGGTPIGLLNDAKGKKYSSKTQNAAIMKQIGDNTYVPLGNERVVIESDGVVIFDSNVVTRADLINIARTLGLLPVMNALTSSSLASTAPSATSSRIIYDYLLDATVLSYKAQSSRKNKRDLTLNYDQGSTTGLNNNAGIAIVDLKYEQGRFTEANEGGDIKSITLAVSTMFKGFEVGAFVPYEYMDFESFEGHKTGVILYAKKDWLLPQHLKLTTVANFNYIATYITGFALTNTFGGGLSSALTYDDGGRFVPRISFSAQYNTDDYYKANDFITDNEQYLIKVGASLGYRLFDNIALQGGMIYTRDITDYSTSFNRGEDKDFYSIKFGATYTVSNMWQVNLNYKRIIGLENYYSNTVFLGTTMDF